MAVNREAILEALLAQLATAGTSFKVYTRRWRSIWDDPKAKLTAVPFLVQWDQNEDVVWTNRGIGNVQLISVNLEIYAKIPSGLTQTVPDKTTPGSSVINPLIDAVFEALAPDGPDGVQTLGGLVLDCRIEGNIAKAYGDEDPSGLCGARVPVRILVGGVP